MSETDAIQAFVRGRKNKDLRRKLVSHDSKLFSDLDRIVEKELRLEDTKEKPKKKEQSTRSDVKRGSYFRGDGDRYRRDYYEDYVIPLKVNQVVIFVEMEKTRVVDYSHLQAPSKGD